MYYFISHARDLLMLTVCTLWGCPQSACSQLSVCLSGLLYVLCPNKLVPAPTVMKQWEFVVCQMLVTFSNCSWQATVVAILFGSFFLGSLCFPALIVHISSLPLGYPHFRNGSSHPPGQSGLAKWYRPPRLRALPRGPYLTDGQTTAPHSPFVVFLPPTQLTFIIIHSFSLSYSL